MKFNKKPDKTIFVYGTHAVQSLLTNPKRICLTLFTVKQNANEVLLKLAQSRNVAVEYVDIKQIEKLVGSNINHQNIVLEAKILVAPSIEEIIEQNAKNSTIIILDQVNDPQNIGAVLRSASGFSADAVIIPEHHSPNENASIIKCAAGASEIIPLIKETNLVQTINILKKNGYWIYGFAAGGSNSIINFEFAPKTVLVFGSEHKGIRKLVLDNCDELVRIPINPRLESLNVSVAVSIALFNLTLKL